MYLCTMFVEMSKWLPCHKLWVTINGSTIRGLWGRRRSPISGDNSHNQHSCSYSEGWWWWWLCWISIAVAHKVLACLIALMTYSQEPWFTHKAPCSHGFLTILYPYLQLNFFLFFSFLRTQRVKRINSGSSQHPRIPGFLGLVTKPDFDEMRTCHIGVKNLNLQICALPFRVVIYQPFKTFQNL